MITEAQRRALFALREALHLCEVADISLRHDLDHLCLSVGLWPNYCDIHRSHIGSAEVSELLALCSEHPE